MWLTTPEWWVGSASASRSGRWWAVATDRNRAMVACDMRQAVCGRWYQTHRKRAPSSSLRVRTTLSYGCFTRQAWPASHRQERERVGCIRSEQQTGCLRGCLPACLPTHLPIHAPRSRWRSWSGCGTYLPTYLPHQLISLPCSRCQGRNGSGTGGRRAGDHPGRKRMAASRPGYPLTPPHPKSTICWWTVAHCNRCSQQQS